MSSEAVSSKNKAASILVIDDDSGVRCLLSKLLQQLGEVHCATNVDEGVELFAKHSPNMVFTDYEMPNKNGIDGIRAMKTLRPHVNIVMLTGSATRELIELAKQEGAIECLTKPFNIQRVRELANKYAAAPTSC